MSDDAPSSSRRYSDREVATIIKHASDMQLRAAPPAEKSGLSLQDLEQIAREAGIDPALIHRAADDLDQKNSDQATSKFLGEVSAIRLERTIDGEVSPDEFETIALEIQAMLGAIGAGSMLGRSMQWTSTSGGRRRGLRTVQITITPKNGRTTIRIIEPLGQVAGAVFAGIMGGAGMGLMPLVGIAGGYAGAAAIGPGFEAAGVVAFCGAFLGTTYMIARTLYGRIVKSRGEKLRDVMSRIAEHVGATAGR